MTQLNVTVLESVHVIKLLFTKFQLSHLKNIKIYALNDTNHFPQFHHTPSVFEPSFSCYKYVMLM